MACHFTRICFPQLVLLKSLEAGILKIVCSYQNCSIGELLFEQCKSTDFEYVGSLSIALMEELDLRVGTELKDDDKICHIHKESLTVEYVRLQKKYGDPFQRRKKAAGSSLRKISLDLAKKSLNTSFKLIPGKKIVSKLSC
eukprot:gene14637-5723_t